MQYFKILAMSGSLAFLAGCQTTQTTPPTIADSAIAAEQLKQKAMVFERDERMYARLLDVAFPILSASAELCEDNIRYEYGFLVADRSEAPRDFVDGFEERYGPGERPLVTVVVRGSPAYEAGLVRGHEILAVNGEETKDGRSSAWRLRDDVTDAEEDMIPLVLSVSKDGVTREVTLVGTPVCNYGVQISKDNVINAYADGENIIFTEAMMRFTESDEELATVVGHEIAHNLMDHIPSKTTNALIGGLFGLLLDSAAAAGGADTGGFYTEMGTSIGARLYGVETEKEADYVGLYLMERAGFDSSNVAYFWRRMGAEHPGSLEESTMPFLDSHPPAPERFLALEAIHEEILTKRANGEPLLPNMRE